MTASIIPSLDDCKHSDMTNGEKQAAKVLQDKLSKQAKIWINPPIPPQNIEPDFLVLDPGRGLLVIEVKDWKIDTVEQANNDTVILINNKLPQGTTNPYKQAKKYAYAITDRLKNTETLFHHLGHQNKGKLIFPYGIVVILTNITRAELKEKDLEVVFGSKSVFCQDEFFQNIDDDLFRNKLWSVLPFRLKERLELDKINTFCQKLGLPQSQKVLVTKTEESIQKIPDDKNQEILNTLTNGIPKTIEEIEDIKNFIDEQQLLVTDNQSENTDLTSTLSEKQIEKSDSSVHEVTSEPSSESVITQSFDMNEKENSEFTETSNVEIFAKPNNLEGEPTVTETVSELTAECIQPQAPPLQGGEQVTSTTSKNSPIVRAIITILILMGGFGTIKSLPYFLKPKLQTDSLKIGTLYEVESQAKLADYLRKELVPNNYFDFIKGKKIEVIVDGDKTLSYQEAQNRMEAKEWDIAFTLSPINSVFAKNNGYSFVGKMFPESTSYESGLFVRKDSNINSLDDLKPTTTVALGSFTSASSFYMPVYDLYGKTLTVKTGNRGTKIVEMVKKGQVNVGAAAIGDSIRADDPELRIIHQSREIPSSGVYLSPRLSPQDQQTIKKLMFDTSPEIKKQSNYNEGQEPDYSQLEKIIERVDQVVLCADFNSTQVKLFCPVGFKPTVVEGKVNGWSSKIDGYILKIVNSNGDIFNVSITPQIIEEATGIIDAKNLQGKTIKIQSRTQPKRQSNGMLNLEVTQPNQINILKAAMK
jgi:ABC-type phosphate/phosphonate transport system substrate-binding protein